MHILSDGYSPVECFVEFVATGEFPETSSSARRTNRSQASVATAGFGGLPTLCNLCVPPWGEVNERYGRSSPPHLCMSNEVRQEARCTTHRERFEKKTKSPLFWGDFAHVRAAALTVIWYKQAHKGGQWCGGVQKSPLRGRWGDGLPDGIVSQTVLIKIWWIAPSGGLRVPRLHSKSMRRNQPISPMQQPNSSAGWNNAGISERLSLGWLRGCAGSRRVSELVILRNDGNN